MDSDDIMPTEKLKSMSQELLSYGPGHVSIGIVKYFSSMELVMATIIGELGE